MTLIPCRRSFFISKLFLYVSNIVHHTYWRALSIEYILLHCAKYKQLEGTRPVFDVFRSIDRHQFLSHSAPGTFYINFLTVSVFKHFLPLTVSPSREPSVETTRGTPREGEFSVSGAPGKGAGGPRGGRGGNVRARSGGAGAAQGQRGRGPATGSRPRRNTLPGDDHRWGT